MIRNYSEFNKKYRAWDKEKEIMIKEPSYILVDGNGHFTVFDEDKDPEGRWCDGEGYILMESIGAKDKNKKDILDLDVTIDENDSKGVVVWKDGLYRLFADIDGDICPMIVTFDMWPEDEIIGTIFDSKHKELYNRVKNELGLE